MGLAELAVVTGRGSWMGPDNPSPSAARVAAFPVISVGAFIPVGGLVPIHKPNWWAPHLNACSPLITFHVSYPQ